MENVRRFLRRIPYYAHQRPSRCVKFLSFRYILYRFSLILPACAAASYLPRKKMYKNS